MARYGLAVDIEKCTGCHACFIACKDEFTGNDYPPTAAAQTDGQKWLRLLEVEQGTGTKIKVDYIPVMCQHCGDPACLKAATGGEVYRRPDGIVIIDPRKAKGHKELVTACPYGAISWNQAEKLPQKCTLCAHMLDNGEKTVRCAEVCPTGALVFGDLDDPHSPISRLLAAKAGQVESYKPELATRPRTKYIGLPKLFIAGEVLLADKPGECAKGASVSLRAAGEQVVIMVKTDFLGDFEFRGLARNSDYIIRAEYEGYQPAELTVRTCASLNAGEILLKPR